MFSSLPSWRQLLWPVALFFLSFILIYGLSFIRLGLHQDEILDFYGQANDTYIAAGRWLTAAYRYFFGLGANVWSASIVAGLFISIAIGVQTRLFDIQGKVNQALFTLLSILTNQLAYILIYSFLSDALALGILCATLAVYVIFKMRLSSLWRGMLAALLLCISLGTYQTNALYFGVLVLAYLFLRHLKGENILRWKLMAGLATVSITAVALWMLIRNCTLHLASPEALEYTLNYQKGMSQWGDFSSLSWTARFYFVAHYTKATLLEACGLVHGGQWLNLSSLLALAILTWRVLKSKRALLGILLLLLIWLLPYALTLGLGTVQDARAHIASGLSIAFLGTLAWQQLSLQRQKQCYLPLVVLLSFCFLKSLYWVSEKTKYEAHYYQLACQKLQDMESLRQKLSFTQEQDLEMVIFWESPIEGQKKEFMQPSFGQQMPPVGVLNWYAAHNNLHLIRGASHDEAKKYQALMKEKKAWPSFESISQDGKRLYVKVSEYYKRPSELKL